MSRVKLKFPNQKPNFSTEIPLRITDMNYGNHLGNDSVLSIIHESRSQWLKHENRSEIDVGGSGLIMADVMIAYKNEGYYGDILEIDVFVDNVSLKSFDLYYCISTKRKGQQIKIAEAKTGMACFDYENRKVVRIPAEFLKVLEAK